MGVAMRGFLLAAMMVIGAGACAQAADMPDLPILRGSYVDGLTKSRANWDGFYLGAQGGYGSSDENFNGSTSNMIAALLANTTIESEMQVSQWNLGLGKQSARTSGFGGFVGYNSQWDDVVIGVEASYLHGSFGGASTASQSLVSPAALSDGFFHAVTATSRAAISISDIGIDVNLIGGLFLRGEWEYIRFTSAVDTSINTVRAGLGYKF